MERDFMGLNSKDSVVVKEEFVEGRCEDSGFARSSGVPWKLSSKMSTLPNFMSLKIEQDEKPSKMKLDLLPSHGYIPKSSSDMFGDIQNFRMKQQFLGGNPLTAPPSYLPSTATEQRTNSKAPSGPHQLTIFYGGTINVFDDISPEKAQAIMFLAGNGSLSSKMAQMKLRKKASENRVLVGQPMNMPMSSVDANNDHLKVSTTIGMSTTPVKKVEPPRAILSIGSPAATAMISSAIPQARKASLARFLEKRKERVMSASPYNLNKNKNADYCESPESIGLGFSATSGVGSTSKDLSK